MIFVIQKEVRIPMGEDVLILVAGDRLEALKWHGGKSYSVQKVNGHKVPLFNIYDKSIIQKLKGASNAVAKKR